VRSYNASENANIQTIGELVQKTESRNAEDEEFGRKSLNEIKDILAQMGLSLACGSTSRAMRCRDRRAFCGAQLAAATAASTTRGRRTGFGLPIHRDGELLTAGYRLQGQGYRKTVACAGWQ